MAKGDVEIAGFLNPRLQSSQVSFKKRDVRFPQGWGLLSAQALK